MGRRTPRTPDQLIDLRRDLHRHAEPAWREFYTTARIVEAIDRIGVDERYVGETVVPEDRAGVPDEPELERWHEAAEAAGADPAVLAATAGGYTGAIAVLRRGEGPTVGLRVDIDALPRPESESSDHEPTAAGFRSETGAMHACGHDAHAAIGVGVLAAIVESDFGGTFKVFFQPAEEAIGGGRPLAGSGHLDDVDYLLCVHVGLDRPTGEVVPSVEGFLSVSQFAATFAGTPAHAGARPNRGQNAVQAAAAAVGNLYSIPRHEAGKTRVNAGVIEGGTASNVIPEAARIEGEIRGGTTELRDYMRDHAERVLAAAAEMHGCDVEVEYAGEAPSATGDDELAALVAEAAGSVQGVDSIADEHEMGASEDATYLMRRVQERGGLATYVGVGSDHPGGHHTASFDVDEASIGIAVDVLAGTILEVAERRL